MLQEVIQDLRAKKLAGVRFEREGRSRFRDCVIVAKNGKLGFERYCYGEAASLVCSFWATGVQPDGTIDWDYSTTDYSGKTEAPQKVTGVSRDALLFDDKEARWLPKTPYKSLPQAGVGRLSALFGK